MKTKNSRRRFMLLTILLASTPLVGTLPGAFSQESGSSPTSEKPLIKELEELQAKVGLLEAMLEDRSLSKVSISDKGTKTDKGMKMGMGKGKKMKMGRGMEKKAGMGMGMQTGGGMPSMGMMGRAPKMGRFSMDSALPGFPGASHLYHIGETGFFLNHPEHLALSTDQQKELNGIKTKTLLADANFVRQIDEAEQQLWTFTAAAEPDIKKIQASIQKIARLTGDRRLAFIRGVGEAALILSEDQRQKLVGEYATKGNQPDSTNPNE